MEWILTPERIWTAMGLVAAYAGMCWGIGQKARKQRLADDAEGNAALEDMEDVIDACIGQKGCQVGNLLQMRLRIYSIVINSLLNQVSGQFKSMAVHNA